VATETRDIHIHLTAQPGTTVHVTVSNDQFTVRSDDAKPGTSNTAISADEVIEAAIQRLEGSGTSPNIREAISGLLAMGYTLRVPQTGPGNSPGNYLRIMDPKYTAHGMGYLTPSAFLFSRQSDRERLKELPGATLLSTTVNFSHVQSAQLGLDAARLLKS
jgi:hypothetical protein